MKIRTRKQNHMERRIPRRRGLGKLFSGFLTAVIAVTMLGTSAASLMAGELSTEYSLAGAGSGQDITVHFGTDGEQDIHFHVNPPAEVSEEEETEVETGTEADGQKRVFTYEDDKVLVTAALEKADAVPSDAVLRVTPVTPDTDGYNYDAYMQALNENADRIGSEKGVPDGTGDKSGSGAKQQSKNASESGYDQSNTLLYDIAFIVPEYDAEGNPIEGTGVEYEPAGGSVSVSIQFKSNQLSEEIHASAKKDVSIVHMSVSDNAKEGSSTTADIKDLTADDISVEEVKSDISVSGSESADFELDSFSIIAIVGTVMEKNILASDGHNYRITVTCGADSEIPKEAELEVTEILPSDQHGDEEASVHDKSYEEYVAYTENALGMEEGSAGYIRLFDIKIVDKEDHSVKYQPKEGTAVDVRIELADAEDGEQLSVVHFADGKEEGDVVKIHSENDGEGAVLEFAAAGFSVYGIVSSGDTTSLNGRTFALINSYTSNAMQGTMQNSNTRLSAEKVTISDRYVNANADITTWTFTSARNGKYYIQSSDEKYLYIGGYNVRSGYVTLSDTPQALTVTAGSGSHSGQIRITNDSKVAINNYNGRTSDGFGAFADSGDNEWFTTYDLVILNPAYTANKISVQDITDGQKIILYKSVYNNVSEQYEDYIIDGNGNLVKAYDKGDQVTLRSAVSPLWKVIIHWDATTNEPNGYYDFYNEETRMYLSPQRDGTLVSSDRPGVILNGRRDGEYNSTIERWDTSSMAYYGYQITQEENNDPTLSSGTGTGSQAFSFAAYTSETTSGLHEVKTISNTAAGITIKMFDYPDRNTITNVVGGNTYIEGNYYNNSGQASMTLTSGYPMFGNKSASALFGNTSYYKGDGDHLFLESVYNATGYYEYSAFNNFARYNNNGTFTVYQEIGTPSSTDDKYYYQRGNFFPFNDLDPSKPATNTNDYTGDGSQLDMEDPTNGGRLYLINNQNFYFGMSMEFTFMQPKDGYYLGSPMVYEFNGDDDMWVYIDGVKILDIGGVHDALPGTINFATGEITYGRNMNNDKIPRTIKACFKEAGIFPDGSRWDNSKVDQYFKGDTFVDYGSHQFNMFYMEHGAGASNLEMRFNLPVIEKGKFAVEKQLDGTTQQKFANVYFAYQAFKKDGENDVPLTRAVYTGTENQVSFYNSVIINGKTYTNVFYLKPGESATFDEMPEDVAYYVQELGVGTDYYDEIIVNDVKIDGVDATETDGVYPTSVATVANRAKVTYTNHCSEKNLNELRITKKLSEGSFDDGSTFEFRLLLENAGGQLAPYSTGDYYIQNEAGEYFFYENGQLKSNGKTEIKASVSGNNGTIAGIPAGYTVVIKDLLADTDFYVEETRVLEAGKTGQTTLRVSNWELEKKEIQAGSCEASDAPGTDWSGYPITADGKIMLNTTAQVTFTNRRKSGTLEVKKETIPAVVAPDKEFQVVIQNSAGQFLQSADMINFADEAPEAPITVSVKHGLEIKNLPADSYTVTELLGDGTSRTSLVDISGYRYDGTTYRTTAGADDSENPVTVTIIDGGSATVTITNTYTRLATVTVIKNVIGTDADQDASYRFTSTGLTETSDRFQLHGRQLPAELAEGETPTQVNRKIYTEVPVGTVFSVTEVSTDTDFDTTIVIDNNGGETGGETSLSGLETGNITVNGDVTVTYTNTRNKQLVSVWKTDSGHNTLTGASFALFEAEDYDDDAGRQRDRTAPVRTSTAVGINGILSLGSLPVGEYRLVETQTPKGYLPADSAIKIYVSSDEVRATQGTKPAEVARNLESNEYKQYWVAGQDDSTWQIRVWNNPGVILPASGGPGTWLFTILGSILALGAGILLWRRRRLV